MIMPRRRFQQQCEKGMSSFFGQPLASVVTSQVCSTCRIPPFESLALALSHVWVAAYARLTANMAHRATGECVCKCVALVQSIVVLEMFKLTVYL